MSQDTKLLVPRKGLEPPPPSREADFKFTAVGSQGFVTVPRRTGSLLLINLLRQFRSRVNFPELRRIANRKNPQKDLQKDTLSPNLKGCQATRQCWPTVDGGGLLYGVVMACD